MKKIAIFAGGILVMAVAACHTQKDNGVTAENAVVSARPESMVVGHSSMIPKAVVYRTNGPFSENVPIIMSANRKEIVSFPAPSDIHPDVAPVELAEGYLLDRHGVGINSAFTRYTYDEYSTLPVAPSLRHLRQMVIPGAIVTDLVRLPFPLTTALADTARVNRLIRQGFPGCDVMLERKAVAPFL